MIFFGQVKRKALKSLKNNWIKLSLAILFISVLPIITQVIVDYITYPTMEYISVDLTNKLTEAMKVQNGVLISEIAKEMVYAYGAVALWNGIVIATKVLCFIFTLSTIKLFVAVSKGEKIGVKSFDFSLKTIWKSFKLQVVKSVIVLLYSLLLIVPGIMKSMAYSQALIISINNPDKKVMDCLKESENIMMGKKMEFFSFKLSFIGWYIVAAIAVTVIEMILFRIIGIQITKVWYLIISVLSIIASIPITVYEEASAVFYYDALIEERSRPKQNPFIIFGPPFGGFGVGQQPQQNNEKPFENFGDEKDNEPKDPFSDF